MVRPCDVSRTIRRRRRELGLSLSQLARRMRSSPATVHRYESGWHRFELYTLQKLASALGWRLRIAFEPLAPQIPAVSPEGAVARLRRLFWDRDLSTEDFERYPHWVLRRVLELGSLEDVRVVLGLMGKQRFLEHLRGLRFASEKTEAFWQAMCEQEGFECTRESCPRGAGISWQR